MDSTIRAEPGIRILFTAGTVSNANNRDTVLSNGVRGILTGSATVNMFIADSCYGSDSDSLIHHSSSLMNFMKSSSSTAVP